MLDERKDTTVPKGKLTNLATISLQKPHLPKASHH